MVVILFISIVLVLCGGCVALAWSQVQRVEAARAGDLRSIAAALRRKPQGERLAELAKKARPESFEARLAADLRATDSEEARVAVLNEALLDVEQALAEGQKWPVSAARIAAWGSILTAAVGYLAETGAAITASLAIGGASVIACLMAKRRAASSARDCREAVDDLVTALVGRLPEAAKASTSRARGQRDARRWRRRGGPPSENPVG